MATVIDEIEALLKEHAAKETGIGRLLVIRDSVFFLVPDLLRLFRVVETMANGATDPRTVFGVDNPCERCNGLGRRVYPTTSTYRGGAGGNMPTTGLCDRCWGSGEEGRPWTNPKLYGDQAHKHAKTAIESSNAVSTTLLVEKRQAEEALHRVESDRDAFRDILERIVKAASIAATKTFREEPFRELLDEAEDNLSARKT